MKIKRKKNITDKQFDTLQQYVLLSTYLDFPMRNNVSNMKVATRKQYNNMKKEQQSETNFLIKNGNSTYSFILNSFKNHKYLGSKILNTSKELTKIIRLFLKHNNSEYFIVKNDRETPISANGLTKYFNKLFKEYFKNKKISTSMIRHIVISHKNRNDDSILEKEAKEKEIEKTYQHSGGMHDLYVKKD